MDMQKARDFPIYPILISAYSALALLAANQSEVEAGVIFRPLFLLLAASLLLVVSLALILKDPGKAGLLSGIWLILFVTYGHVYNLMEGSETWLAELGRHRILLPLYLVIAAVTTFFVLRNRSGSAQLTRILNIAGLVLLVFPVFQLVSHDITASQAGKEAFQWTFSQPLLQPRDPDNLPDVYFIVLDTYTSSKALAADFGFDNTPFEDALEEMGFYVAECSQTNYTYTQGALTAALNLEYVPRLEEQLGSVGLEDNIWILMKESLVRHQLERIGYKSVAFETSYDWSRIKDADIYLGESQSSVTWQKLNAFEMMWAKSTALLLINDLDIKKRVVDDSVLSHPHSDHIEKQLFVLKTLPEIAGYRDPTFTFAHILIPHVPYVFGADGAILTDPGYYGGDKAGPVNEEYLQKGYTGEIAFLNSQLETILAQILEQSDTPPIIVLMGDHGVRDDNRPKNFFAVYLPDGGEQALYPSITPVNIFRIIFDKYYGTSYGLLPDVTYTDKGEAIPVPDTCK